MSQNEELLFVLKMRDEASAVLKRHIAAVDESATAHDKAARQFTAFQRALSAASGGATTYGGAIRGLGANLASLGAPTMGAALGARTLKEAYEAAVDVLKEMIDKTVAYEKSQKALAGAQRLSQGSTGLSGTDLNDLVVRTAQASSTDETAVRNAMAQVIAQGHVSGDTLKGTMDVAVQLAGAWGKELPEAAGIMAQALKDPQKGFDALSDAGVRLTEIDRERIRQMEASGGKMAAQAELVRAVAKAVGPGDTSGGGGLSGALKDTTFAWSKFLDQFNDSLLSKAATGVVNLTGEVVKLFTVFDKPMLVEDGDSVDTLTKKIQEQLVYIEGLAAQTGNAAAQKAYEGAHVALTGLMQRYDAIAEKSKEAFAQGEAAKLDALLNDMVKQARDLGLAFDAVSGKMVEVAALERDRRLERAQEALRQGEQKKQDVIAGQGRQYNKADLDKATGDVEATKAVIAGLTKSPGVAKTTPATPAAPTSAGGAPAGKTPPASTGGGSPSVSISREVREQAELADAYMRSTREANALMAAQKAGAGASVESVRDQQSLEFYRALVAMHAEIRKSAEEIPDLEVQAVMAVDATAAYTYDVYRDTYAKIRDLRAKMVQGGDLEEAQQIKLEEAKRKSFTEADRKALATLSVDEAKNIGRLKDETDLMKLKIDLSGRSQVEEDKAIARFEAARERRKVEGRLYASAEEQQRAIGWIDQNEAARIRFADVSEAARRAAGPLAAYFRESTEGWKAYESGIVSALNATDEALTAILFRTKDWQTAMSDVLRAVVQDFAKIAIHQNITAPLASAVFGGGGGGGGGLIGRAFGWLTSQFAGGGIMTSHGPLPLRRYAGGGVATSPQLALFGEGSTPEAYVPVPNGRIPVTLRGGFGGGHTIATNIEVNVGAGGGNLGGGGGGDPTAMASQIGALVTAAFNKNLTEQMRPGGILNPAGAYNPSKVM